MARYASDTEAKTEESKQYTLPPVDTPPLNIIPTQEGSVLAEGELKSPGYRRRTAGWRVNAQGQAEFQDGIFNGEFSIGGTVVTISDVSDLQETLDMVSDAGGGVVYLNVGTYVLTTNITIPDGVTLQGVSRDNCVIDCNSAYGLQIIGSDAYNTGTISINNASTSVVGVGTTFTAAMVGQSILLDNVWYEIASFINATNITIDSAYSNDSLAGAAYTIATLRFNSSIKQLTVHNATLAGVKSQYSMEPTFGDLIIYGCGTGLDLDQVVYPRIQLTAESNGINLDMNNVGGFYIDFSLFGTSTTGAGLVILNSGDATMFNSSVTGNTGDGINLTGCSRIAFISTTINLNGGQGIEFVSGNSDCQLTDMVIDSNTSDGVKLTATTDRIAISTCSITNNGGYGVNIAAASCDDNYIVAPTFATNSSGTINDSGTGTVIIQASDITKGNFGGDGSDGALSITSGTTTINLGGAQSYVKYYSSISITGTGALAFSNPHANGTFITLKSLGDVTLTSSATPMIDASAIGAAAETAGMAFYGTGGGAASLTAGGVKASLATTFNTGNFFKTYYQNTSGGGSAGGVSGSGAVGGVGGIGGPSLVIECGGNWNFTTAGGISVAGGVGQVGTNGVEGGGGGGGGGGGNFLGLYNNLTANSGTVTTTGGAGGAGGTTSRLTNHTQANGGAGGGSALNAGTNGTVGGTVGANVPGASGSAGGTGNSLITQYI